MDPMGKYLWQVMPMWAAILRFFNVGMAVNHKVQKTSENTRSYQQADSTNHMLNTCKQHFWVQIPLACENPFCFFCFFSKMVDFQNKQRYGRPIDVTNRILKGYLPTVQGKNSRLIVTPEVETSIGGSVGSSWAFRWKMWSDHRRGAGSVGRWSRWFCGWSRWWVGCWWMGPARDWWAMSSKELLLWGLRFNVTKFQEMGPPASGAIFFLGACFIFFFFLGGGRKTVFFVGCF